MKSLGVAGFPGFSSQRHAVNFKPVLARKRSQIDSLPHHRGAEAATGQQAILAWPGSHRLTKQKPEPS